ncbi:MAG: hypothetical protein KF873_02050 [Gemmataceae bacterium]|nr:hypothetical protein [Gemmataceae bacterium]
MLTHKQLADAIARQIAGLQLDLADLLGRVLSDARQPTESTGTYSRITLQLEAAEDAVAKARRIAPPLREAGRGA